MCVHWKWKWCTLHYTECSKKWWVWYEDGMGRLMFVWDLRLSGLWTCIQVIDSECDCRHKSVLFLSFSTCVSWPSKCLYLNLLYSASSSREYRCMVNGSLVFFQRQVEVKWLLKVQSSQPYTHQQIVTQAMRHFGHCVGIQWSNDHHIGPLPQLVGEKTHSEELSLTVESIAYLNM